MKRPMVVAYKLNQLTYYLLKFMVKVKHISLPNLLANKELVSELIQQQATAENLAKQLQQLYQNKDLQKSIADDFSAIHRSLRCNASVQAADAILS